jgi:enterochelin esterase-like enzyme
MDLISESIPTRLKTEITPLVDHDQVTFVWRGRTAPLLVGDFTGWADGVPIKLEKQGRGLWTYQLSFPDDAYIEYGFMMGEESIGDPYNPRQTPNGVGSFNNHFSMAGYKPTDLTKKTRYVPHGTVKEYYLSTNYLLFGKERQIHFYQPPVTERVPLVVVWDGMEYLKRVRMNYIVDNLIAQGRIRPFAMAFINNGGEESRTCEYACNEATVMFLISEVLPLARKELKLLDVNAFPGAYGVCGSSMGGLMALYTAARLPHIFGNVLSQSGAFTLGNYDTVVYGLLTQDKKLPLNLWLDVGRYDLPGLLETNRRMQALLMQHNYSYSYHEYNAGHNDPAWRDDLWRGLEALFGVSK